jgi:4-hydroxy-2-oxoheptanedioate aldolase
MFVLSGSPAAAEALAHSGLDFVVLDAQHGPVGYGRLEALLSATSAAPAKRIVRVGGPQDQFGMQQALECVW